MLEVLFGAFSLRGQVMPKAGEFVLAGFTFISWGTFFLGLGESVVGGFLTAALFASIFNVLATRGEAMSARTLTSAAQHHQPAIYTIFSLGESGIGRAHLSLRNRKSK